MIRQDFDKAINDYCDAQGIPAVEDFKIEYGPVVTTDLHEVDSGGQYTLIKWHKGNVALFLNKTDEEVLEEMKRRWALFEPVERLISRGEFYAAKFNMHSNGFVAFENPSAEGQFIANLCMSDRSVSEIVKTLRLSGVM